jgi:hypothetical protein
LNSDPSLSIVIVSWNTRDLLAQCLASVFTQQGDEGAQLSLEVFVVDNASQDGSLEMVRDRFPQAHLLENPGNPGFAAANNQGIRQCRGRYILMLNPDTIVKPGALATLVDFMDAHPQAGAAGPRLLNADGSLQESCYPRPTLGREFWRLFHLDKLATLAIYPMQRWRLDTPREVDVLMGACLLVRWAVFDQVGLWEEMYFMYSEEVDLCTRVQAAGWGLFWVPQAEVVHFGGQSTRQVAEKMFLRLYQSKILYFRRHQGHPAAIGYKIILGAASLGRLVVAPAALLEPPERRSQHLQLARNYGRLLLSLPGL